MNKQFVKNFLRQFIVSPSVLVAGGLFDQTQRQMLQDEGWLSAACEAEGVGWEHPDRRCETLQTTASSS
jgi:hypothetical protein